MCPSGVKLRYLNLLKIVEKKEKEEEEKCFFFVISCPFNQVILNDLTSNSNYGNPLKIIGHVAIK